MSCCMNPFPSDALRLDSMRCILNSVSQLLAVFIVAFASPGATQDVFSEELLTTWVSSAHLLVHLRFDQATTASRLHSSFPHSIQQLANSLPLNSVELALTSGRWDYTEWGWPLLPVRPVGAALDAFFRPGLRPKALASHWSTLVHALSGLSCASVNLLRDPSSVNDGTQGVRGLANQQQGEHFAFSNGTGAASGKTSGQRLQALLPREALCTENLTPWLRLLPCRDQAGLASLLHHRPTVFGAEYISLDLRVEKGTTSAGRPGVHLVQTFTFVVRTSAPLVPATTVLDLETLLGARVSHFCPAAFRSQAYVVRPETALARAPTACSSSSPGNSIDGTFCSWPRQPNDEALSPARGSLLVPCMATDAAVRCCCGDGSSSPVAGLLMYDTLELLEVAGHGLHLRLSSPPPSPRGLPAPRSQPARPWRAVHLTVSRFVTGSGLLRGEAVLAVRRSRELQERLAHVASSSGCGSSSAYKTSLAASSGSRQENGRVCLAHVLCVHQVFPWYVRPWVHTLTLRYDGQVQDLQERLVARKIQPAVQRESPGVLDLCFHAPAAVAELQLQMAFSKAFLSTMEYPPDAHRGFDIPAALVSYMDPLNDMPLQWHAFGGGAQPQNEGPAGEVISSPLLHDLLAAPVGQVHAQGLLVPLAAPDFSMPYNVLCLSSTVLAVYFGAVLNLLTRRVIGTVGGAGDAHKKASIRVLALKVALAVAFFIVLALYLDADVREQAQQLLSATGLQSFLRP